MRWRVFFIFKKKLKNIYKNQKKYLTTDNGLDIIQFVRPTSDIKGRIKMAKKQELKKAHDAHIAKHHPELQKYYEVETQYCEERVAMITRLWKYDNYKGSVVTDYSSDGAVITTDYARP